MESSRRQRKFEAHPTLDTPSRKLRQPLDCWPTLTLTSAHLTAGEKTIETLGLPAAGGQILPARQSYLLFSKRNNVVDDLGSKALQCIATWFTHTHKKNKTGMIQREMMGKIIKFRGVSHLDQGCHSAGIRRKCQCSRKTKQCWGFQQRSVSIAKGFSQKCLGADHNIIVLVGSLLLWLWLCLGGGLFLMEPLISVVV